MEQPEHERLLHLLRLRRSVDTQYITLTTKITDELIAELERLRDENERLRQPKLDGVIA